MALSTPLIRPPVAGGILRNFSDSRTAPGPYVMNGDFLRLNASSTDASATLQINGRLLTVEGEIVPFNASMVITGTGNQTSIAVPLVDGWIVGFIVFVSAGTITDGEIQASVEVVQGSGTGLTRVMSLASGEVTNTRSLGLGSSNGFSVTSNPIQYTATTLTVADPAAGAEWSLTVPANTAYRTLGVEFTLTCSATVATRGPGIVQDDGAVNLSRIRSTTTYTATQVAFVCGSPLGLFSSQGTGTSFIQMIPLPSLALPAGSRIRSLCDNLQASDQYTAIRVNVLSSAS